MLDHVKMIAPAGCKSFTTGRMSYQVAEDGTVEVPHVVVENLKSHGFNVVVEAPPVKQFDDPLLPDPLLTDPLDEPPQDDVLADTSADTKQKLEEAEAAKRKKLQQQGQHRK